MDTFRTCHRKYFGEYDQCLKPRLKSWALLDGGAFDYGLNSLYNALSKAPTQIIPSNMEDRAKAVIKADIRQKWAITEDILTGIDQIYEKGGRNEEECYFHREKIKAMLRGYVLAYPPDEFDSYTAQPQGEVSVHNTYMREKGFILKFKADAIIRKGDKSYLFETKTTSASSMELYLNSLRLDDQPDTYLYGFRRMGELVLGVIYNVVRKSRHKKNKFESKETFISRVQKSYIEDTKKPDAERKYYLRPPTIYRSPDDLRRFEEDIKRVASDMEAYMNYKSPKQCGLMYGEKCPWIPMCEGKDSPELYIGKRTAHEEYSDG
jgi:hypothetical protein